MTHRDAGVLVPEACIAIVGMACHFPDARTPDEFWQNLASGRDSVRDYDEASLRAAGVSDGELANPDYVRSGLPMDGFDDFDAAFFGISPGEAKIMDPQHRRFLECAWSALEDAGHTPASADGNIGVFAGSGMHWYLLRNLMSNPDLIRDMGEFLIRHTANDKDFLATRVSYHLNLHGPSINVQTACSTSLVAVHLACQSLLNGESDLALAGGSTIQVPHNVGYLHRQGEVSSPDSRCRALDADGQGTGFGSGCGVVVLRRLSDALADGDRIDSVILGSAVNNDGAAKASYFAPSVDRYAHVVAEAIAISDIAPGTIGYVESHGTGTRIGDPMAVAALTQGFGPSDRRQYCALGSVKSNIGHLDTAAGVAGLIKVALSLRHRKLPASLHLRTPNPEIDFANSPFFVNTKLADWPQLGAPLRAGIGAAGVGGTNAHLIVQEAPRRAVEAFRGQMHQPATCILPLSAKSPATLARVMGNLLAHLTSNPDLPLLDVAWTLRNGRVPFAHRVALVGRDVRSVVAQLQAGPRPTKAAQDSLKLAFVFPGQGAEYPNMSRRLHATDPDFRVEMDRCLAVLRGLGRQDAIAVLYTDAADPEAWAAMHATAVAGPLLFCVEYALAKSLLAKGIRPAAMIGYSLGEYVAACLAGVFTLQAALTLVCRRGELIETLPKAAMLAVSLPPESIVGYLSPRVSLAGINGPQSCVCAGDVEAIIALAERLTVRGIGVQLLESSDASHSPMLDPILPEFKAAVIAAAPAAIENTAIISNVTGTWLTAAQAGSAEYWTSQLRQPVNFMAGIRQLQALGSTVHVEVGPGHALSGLVTSIGAEVRVVSTLPGRGATAPDEEVFAAAGGLLWSHGVDIDWAAWGQPASGQRIGLPTYPFLRQRHWVEPGSRQAISAATQDATPSPSRERFHVIDWQSSIAAPGQGGVARVLVFAGSWGVAASLVEVLRERGIEVVTVETGPQFSRVGSRILMDPTSEAQWDTFADSAGTFSHIAYLWPVDTAMACTAKLTAGCFDHLLRIGQRIDRLCDVQSGLKLLVATANAHQLCGETDGNPYQALVSGPVRTIPLEYPAVIAKWVDFDAARTEWSLKDTVAQLMTELEAGGDDATIAWRNRRRFRSTFTPIAVEQNPAPTLLRTGGCYLITGAFGGVGQVLAEHLAQRYQAHLLLVARTGLPSQADRAAHLARSPPGDTVGGRIQVIGMLEACGAKVEMVTADVADGRALEQAINELGVSRLDGIFHAAGLHDDASIGQKSIIAAHRVLRPKVAGALGLQSLKRHAPDFIVYCSSLDAQSGVAGQVARTSANMFLEAFAAMADAQSSTTRHIAIGWGAWRDADRGSAEPGVVDVDHAAGLSNAEALAALESILAGRSPSQVIVATGNVQRLLAEVRRSKYPAPPVVDTGMTPQERVVLEACRELIGSDAVQLDDNFFDAGGHSLLALTMVSRIEKETGIRLNILKVASSSLRALAVELGSQYEPVPVDAPGLGARLNRWVGATLGPKRGGAYR